MRVTCLISHIITFHVTVREGWLPLSGERMGTVSNVIPTKVLLYLMCPLIAHVDSHQDTYAKVNLMKESTPI